MSHSHKESHKDHDHKHGDNHSHTHSHDNTNKSTFQLFLPSIISFLLLIMGLALEHIFKVPWFAGWIKFTWFVLAYIPVGFPVLREAVEGILKKDFFSEFFLMSLATLGAFYIGEYAEGVAVMLFYAIGESFQTMAIQRATTNIKTLLDQRPDEVTILENGNAKTIKAKTAQIGQIIQLKPGEKLGLDGELISDNAAFNTAALTGESKPDNKKKGDIVLAGMINLNTVSQVKISTAYQDSKLSKILDLVQNASKQKAPTELFINRFAKIYTPIVVGLAIAICVLPYFFVDNYIFNDWLYRALVFLVISCPCALVISIPLGYFGGIGAGSKHGILFKGSNFLDTLAEIDYVVMDKTGTLTEGIFEVQEVKINEKFNKQEVLNAVNIIESHTTHPIATAIRNYVGEIEKGMSISQIQEIPGFGLKALYKGKEILLGNFKLLDKNNVKHNVDVKSIIYTTIALAYDKEFVGYITISDKVKKEAAESIKAIHNLNVKTAVLSGDKNTVVQYVAKQLQIPKAFGELLPEDKINKVKDIASGNIKVAFIGDGVNDAPVIALSDVGIAMGGLGSDAAIESADVVIQDDNLSKIPLSIKIGKATKKIVWQNIALAFIVKAIVLILGAFGIANMWEAVFADVGVALLAILNAVRIQYMKF